MKLTYLHETYFEIQMDKTLSGPLQSSRSRQQSVLSCLPVSAAFLLGLPLDPKDQGNIFLDNVNPTCTLWRYNTNNHNMYAFTFSVKLILVCCAISSYINCLSFKNVHISYFYARNLQ
jgi:hypothetical protein